MFCQHQLLGGVRFFLFEGLDVLLTHGDFAIEWLHVSHCIVAFQLEFLFPSCHTGFGGFRVLSFVLRHHRSRFLEAIHPVSLSLQKCLSFAAHFKAGRKQSFALLFFLQLQRFHSVVEHASAFAFQSCQFLRCIAIPFKDVTSDGTIEFRACQFFQKHRFVRLLRSEEVGKTVLRQEDGACELRIVQSHCPFNCFREVTLVKLLFSRCEHGQRSFWGGELTARSHFDAPSGFVALSAFVGKDHCTASTLAPTAQQVTDIACLQRRRVGSIGRGVNLSASFGSFKAWCFVVEREADGVKNGGFSRTGVAGDGKECCRAQWLRCEINDLLAFNGG